MKTLLILISLILLGCTNYYESEDWLIEGEYEGRLNYKVLWVTHNNVKQEITIYSNKNTSERKGRVAVLLPNGWHYRGVNIEYIDSIIDKYTKEPTK